MRPSADLFEQERKDMFDDLDDLDDAGFMVRGPS